MRANREGKSTPTIVCDSKTKFPILSIPNIPFDVMWLPLTRIQLEFFLSDVNDVRYDAAWYEQVISKDNPRISPSQLNSSNFKGALATNILLKEVARIADWYGYHEKQIYDLPTAKQWEMIASLSTEQAAISLEDIPDDADPRVRTILKRINEIGKPDNLAHQMLLGWNISEYVYRDDARQVCQVAAATLAGKVVFTSLRSPHDLEGNRQADLSFRLIRQEL
jgi:hypothetical protein